MTMIDKRMKIYRKCVVWSIKCVADILARDTLGFSLRLWFSRERKNAAGLSDEKVFGEIRAGTTVPMCMSDGLAF